jgi:hypothetical protein
LSFISEEEHRLNTDLSEKVIVIDPADTEFSVGINPLDIPKGEDSFLRVTQFAEVLEHRWGLHAFGARTDELLRNSLLVLAECGLSLLELDPLLSQQAFRHSCLAKVAIYFQLSPQDAHYIATALDGGKPLAERLKNLPRRHLVLKSGGDALTEVAVPALREPKERWRDLYERSRKRWAKPRAAVEAEIQARETAIQGADEEALHDWE